MDAVALALCSAVAWGFADFLGGVWAKRMPAAVVVFGTLPASSLVLAVLLAAGAWHPPGTYLWWGVAGAVAGTLGVAFFYTALAAGKMSVVAPIAGTGLVVPVIAGVISGERPSVLQVSGIAVAGLGVVLASGPELRGAATNRRSVAFACAAALCFGAALAAFAEGSQVSVAMTTAANNVIAAAGAGAWMAWRRVWLPRRIGDLGGLAAIGLLNLVAVGAYGFATRAGLVSVVAVLASLYPVATVLLARRVYAERLARVQGYGVLAALVGIVLLAGG